MPEILWHMWFVLFLASLLRSENFSKNHYAVASGIFLGLTILARPAESILLITPALTVYFFYLYQKNKTNVFQFAINVFLLSASALGCSLVSWFGWHPVVGFFIIALSILLFSNSLKYYSKKETNDRDRDVINHLTIQLHSKNFFVALTCALSIWLIFYARHIIFWTYDNSFGIGATTNDQVNLSRNIFPILWDILNVYGLALSVALLAIAFCVAIFTKKTTGESRNLKYVFIALASMLVPMLFAYSVTGTSDNRRIFLGIVFFLLAASYYIAHKDFSSKLMNRSVVTLFVLILTIQSLAITAVVSQNNILLAGKKYLENYYVTLTYRYPKPNEGYDSEVIREIKLLGVKNSRIAVFSLGMFSDKVLYQAESLRYVTLEIDRSLDFGTLWGYIDYEPYLDVVKRLKQNGFNYVLLEDIDNPISDPTLRNRLKSHTFFVTELLKIIKDRGEDNIIGLDLVGSFNISHRKQYLFRVYDPFQPKISASSQLNEYSADGLLDAQQPGWHARQNPTYPQTINLEFKISRSISGVEFLPQDGNAQRAPKSIRVKASDDGKSWTTVAASDDVCVANSPGGWHNFKLPNQVKTRFLEIEIMANCGDPNFLTLRGLKIE